MPAVAATPATSRRPILGPIFTWELTGLARKRRYFLVRVTYALALAAMMWVSYQSSFVLSNLGQSSLQQASWFAESFFHSFLWLQTFVALGLTPAFIATAIPSEKERKTIEYLFVSDLTNREIILGKLGARMLNLLMVILVGVPIVAFAGLFGGVDYAGLLISTTGTILVMGSVATTCLVASLYASTTRRALINCYGLMFFLSVGVPALIMIGTMIFDQIARRFIPELSDWLTNLPGESWFQTCTYILAMAHPLAPMWITTVRRFGGSAGIPFSMTETFVILAVIHLTVISVMTFWAIRSLRSSYRADVSKTVRAPRLSPISRRMQRNRRPSRMLESSPLIWKEVRRKGLGQAGIVRNVVAGLLILLFYGSFLNLFFGRSPYESGIMQNIRFWMVWVPTIVVVLTMIVVGFRAATCVSEERDRDCWTSLLMTPSSALEIVMSKFLGSLQPIGFVVLLIAPVFLIGLFCDAVAFSAIIYWHCAVALFGVAVAGLGVYNSLSQPTSNRAIAFTLVPAALMSGLLQMLATPLFFWEQDIMPFIAGSIPWISVGIAPMVGSSEMDDEIGLLAMIGMIFLLVYAVLGCLFLLRAVRSFPEATGRIEGSPNPTPVG